MKSKNKERVVAWLDPQLIKEMEGRLSLENMKNKSEFVSMAVEFYLGFLNTGDSTRFLSEALLDSINGTIKTTESRLANNLFRLTVELSMVMNLLAADIDVDEEQLRQLRNRCIRDIRQTKGRISFEDAVEYQQQ